MEKTCVKNFKELAVAVDQFFKYATPNRLVSLKEINITECCKPRR